MKSAFRAATVAHLVALCPVLFTGCGANHQAAEGSPPPTSTVSGVSAASTTTEVRNVDAKSARRLVAENPDIQIIDVRTPEEFEAGHLAGAKNLDINAPDFRDRLSKLDRDATYVVHCAAGGRSTRSLSRFKDLGFKSVVHLDGGYNGWVEAGLPVEK